MHRIKKDALFLIDGSYLLYRSYYAIRPLQNSKGVPTQATYGFCRTIKKMIDVFDPKGAILVWDSKGKTFRSEIYQEYKATRQAPPSDLFVQKDYIMQFADLIGLKQIAVPGYEADDLIGSVVKDYKGDQIVIVGPDKDLYQLLSSDKVLIFDPFKERIVDEYLYKQEKGFGPDKVAFYYSLIGDTSDNIPGVAGIGPKSAQELVNQFDSIEDLYKNLDKVKKDRTKLLLEQNKENAFLSFKLFSLKYHDVELKKTECSFDKNNLIKAKNLFEELDFTSLVKELQKIFGKEVEAEKKSTSEKQLSMFGETEKVEEKKGKIKEWTLHIVRTQEELGQLVENLGNSKEFAIDTETTGLRPLMDDLVGISFAFNNKEAYYIPFGHKDHEHQIGKEEVLEKLKPVFESQNINKILHNTKFDQLALEQNGIEVENIVFDSLLAANLLRKLDEEKINLKVLSVRYLDEEMQTYKEVVGKYKNFSLIPIEQAARYAAHDALQTFKLKPILQKDLYEDKKLEKIFQDVELPLSQVLLEMEKFGITLDIDKLKDVGAEITKDIEKIENKIEAAIENKQDQKINLNSPAQVEHFLFKELGLPVIKKTGKGKPSTDQEVLKELSKVNPIPGMIATYRELSKLKNTYIQPLIDEVNPKTGRIHTSFSQTMVATGRLSSSNPNLQNIPAESEHGIKIRSAFVAPRGKTFLSADYSQVELRVLANLTKDKNLIEAFLHDKDIHAFTASQLFDVSIEKVTHEQRQLGKRINFSIIYGLTPYGLAKDLDIKPSEAKEYIEKYFENYKGVHAWMEKTIQEATECGYTQTWMGRRRYIPALREKNRHLYEAGTRIAKNSPIQGTSAEILKLAMINLDKILKEEKLEAKMVLQIHDELVLELPNEEVEKVEKIVKKCMESVVDWQVPFKVSIRTGKNWEQITK
jgi:DNA polymerase I